MRIACTLAPGRGETDLLLFRVAETLRQRGYRLGGTVQVNSSPDCDGPCDMDVKVLPDGPVIRISQSLGREAKGCRLDPSALETAVGLVRASLDQHPDVLIVNKFGKHEADGRGFREVIAEALGRDLPVLVGVNRMNLAAFHDFTGGIAVELPPREKALTDWIAANRALPRKTA